jgi:beta-glucoside operon transcriptional antiterminator
MPSVYELEQGYPLEVQIGRHLLGEINRRFRVRLPKSEVQSIAMHFINARDAEPDTGAPQGDIRQQYDEVLEQTTQIIEWEMQLKVARDTFNYARFATHLQYLLDRLFTERHIDTDNLQLYGSIREEYPAVAACVDKISDYYKNTWQVELSEEEKLYLMLHVNRVCAQ